MHSAATLSAILPALDAAASLPATLAALREGRETGLLREILLVDGGSRDGTREIAEAEGVGVLRAARGRGTQLAAGADAASGEWLLFLHADTCLATGWSEVVARFLADPGNAERAGYFRFALDDESGAARRLERIVALRCRYLALPYGDQGLLIARRLHDAVGGYRALPLMEDVDLVRRLGRHRLAALDATATTSAARYRSGYLRRMMRNLGCLALYYLGVPPRLIAWLYA